MLSRGVILIYDDKHWLHRDPSGEHPENPYRLEICLNTLRDLNLLKHMDVRGITGSNIDDLTRIHSLNYINFVKEECKKGFHYLDSDTYVNEDSFHVASGFTSTCVKTANEAYEYGKIVIALTRPPGHHAGFHGKTPNASTLGFCLFNHAAAVSVTLLAKTKQVLIIDFDAHHGNGTQEIFWNEPRVIHIDVHQHGLYPGTGWVNEIGGRDARGSKINVPLQPGAGDAEYVWILEKIVKPLVELYKPGVVVVSAGFDAYRNDGLSNLYVTSTAFSLFGNYLHELLLKRFVKTVITVLEGGYGIGLKHGFKSFIEALITYKSNAPSISIKSPNQKVCDTLKKVMLEHHGVRL